MPDRREKKPTKDDSLSPGTALFVLLLIVAGIGGCFVIRPRDPGPAPEVNVDQFQPGMTSQQVQQVLGEAHHTWRAKSEPPLEYLEYAWGLQFGFHPQRGLYGIWVKGYGHYSWMFKTLTKEGGWDKPVQGVRLREPAADVQKRLALDKGYVKDGDAVYKKQLPSWTLTVRATPSEGGLVQEITLINETVHGNWETRTVR